MIEVLLNKERTPTFGLLRPWMSRKVLLGVAFHERNIGEVYADTICFTCSYPEEYIDSTIIHELIHLLDEDWSEEHVVRAERAISTAHERRFE